ncbi:MAG: OmpA family protein [Bacteroidia bacterium]
MKTFCLTILRMAFVAGAIFLFMTSCAAHKKCGDVTAKKKYHGKRYNQALKERDALCDQTKQQSAQLVTANKEISDLKENYNVLNIKYNNLRQSSGSELNKLNDDLDKKQIRLRELESILRKQDSVLNVLNNSVKNALLGFNPDELTVEMKNGKVYVSMSDKLLFKSGDANVEAKGKEALKKLAEVLNKNQDVSIAIEGHTDNVPIKTAVYKDNWDLSAARATNVVRLLSDEYKMDAHRLTAAGKGEYSPIADNATTEGKAKNRRTEIVLSPKLDELMKLITVK